MPCSPVLPDNHSSKLFAPKQKPQSLNELVTSVIQVRNLKHEGIKGLTKVSMSSLCQKQGFSQILQIYFLSYQSSFLPLAFHKQFLKCSLCFALLDEIIAVFKIPAVLDLVWASRITYRDFSKGLEWVMSLSRVKTDSIWLRYTEVPYPVIIQWLVLCKYVEHFSEMMV